MRRVLIGSLLFAVPVASASVLKPGGWSASSIASATDERNFEPTNIGDGKQSTAWAEGEEGAGLGATVEADLGGDRSITGFTIWSGNFYNYEFWGHYNRPKTVVLEFSDGTSQEFTLADEMKPQSFDLPSAKTTSKVKVKVKAVYSGKGVDTAISEIQFRDSGRPTYVQARTVTASSTFPADAEGDYGTANMSDGITDSMWCEGNKTGDGTSEWLQFDFGSSQTVSKLKIRNGAGFSAAYFNKANRAVTGTLTFSDGSTETVNLKDMFFDQTITFPAHTTDRVKLTFTSVKKGTEFNDLCVSEAYFLP